jgi:ribosomal protein S18 acetylase RimI-like enzyme
MRDLLLNKYVELPNPPDLSERLKSIVGLPASDSHDFIDYFLLAAVEADAVDILVTEDMGVHKKAVRLGIEERVATSGDVIDIVRSLFPVTPQAPPAVQHRIAYLLDENDPIFHSLRHDYPKFDRWLQKCKLEHRDAWVINTLLAEHYQGIAIVNQQTEMEHGLTGKVLKICTFKVAEGSRGSRFGELLLKTVFEYAFANAYDRAFITVLPHHTQLIELLRAFGFNSMDDRTERGEMIFVKNLKPAAIDKTLDPLEYHLQFGPFYFRTDVPAFIVPIRPEYHELLFPEAETQQGLFAGQNTFGNSIRKAYLCRSPTRRIAPGNLLFFYLSHHHKSLTCLGVVEKTFVSQDPNAVARMVGKRTVYRYNDIENICSGGEVLAILFRQARIFHSPVTWAELSQKSVLKAPPQSIVKIPEEELPWLVKRIVS